MIESLACFFIFRKQKCHPVLYGSTKVYSYSDAYELQNALSISTYAISAIPNIHFLSFITYNLNVY